MIREWVANTAFKQGDCVLIPDGAGGYMGDANGSKTWLLCCVGSGSSPDTTKIGISGAAKTQNEWATLFEGTGSDGNVTEATVLPASLSGGSGPDGTIRWALGVAYFLNTSAPANGNGSYASPYNSADGITAGQISTQDGTNSTRHLYIKRGTRVVLDSGGGDWLGRGSSRRHYATVTDYGSGTLPVLDARATTGTTAGVLIYKAGSNPARYVRAENFEVFGAAGDGVSIYLGTAEASIAQNDIIVSHVISHDNGASGIQALTGGDVDRSSSSTGITIEYCKAYSNAVYGIAVREWIDGATLTDNEQWNNGLRAPSGAYGVSTIGNYNAQTVTGWSQLSSSPNIWSRAFTRTNDVVAGRYRRSDGTDRVLTVGTYGALSTAYTVANSGGTVQVCLGAGETPNSQTVWLCYNRVKNVKIFNPQSRGTNDYRPAALRYDGDGIGIDQFSQDVVILRPVVEGNGGCGVIANQPYNLRIVGGVLRDNGRQKSEAGQTIAGILINHPQGDVTVINNTVVGNKGDGIRVYSPNAGTVTVTNNLVQDNDGAGFYGTDGVTVMTETYNWLGGNGSEATHVTLDGTDETGELSGYVDADGHLIASGFSIASPNPVAVAGTYVSGVTLRSGRLRPGSCPIGATHVRYAGTARSA